MYFDREKGKYNQFALPVYLDHNPRNYPCVRCRLDGHIQEECQTLRCMYCYSWEHSTNQCWNRICFVCLEEEHLWITHEIEEIEEALQEDAYDPYDHYGEN